MEPIWITRCPVCKGGWYVESKENPVITDHPIGTSLHESDLHVRLMQTWQANNAAVDITDPVDCKRRLRISDCIRDLVAAGGTPCPGQLKLATGPLWLNGEEEPAEHVR